MKKEVFVLRMVIVAVCFWTGTVLSAKSEKRIAARFDYNALNARAKAEYLIPVRPGYEKKNPYWNEFARKYIYAPSFDFKKVTGAAKYHFTLSLKGQRWTFTADEPTANLSPVWNDVPVGRVSLTVEALDRSGNVIAKVGEKKFLRDYPFSGPYTAPVRSYSAAALKAMLFIHYHHGVQGWLKGAAPDTTYELNAYPSKIWGATIRNEVKIAKYAPSLRDDALKIARHAARALMDGAPEEGHPLAYFTQTYFGSQIAAGRKENRGRTMSMESSAAAMALLDLYDLTGEKRYFDFVTGIADTYKRIQQSDGSFFIKYDYGTGRPINNVKAMLHPLLNFLQRLNKQYGIETYEPVRRKAEEWMSKVALSTFDIQAQCEDGTVLNWKPYKNLSNITASGYASYLMKKTKPTKKEMSYAKDLIRFSEDQFVHWQCLPGKDGVETRWERVRIPDDVECFAAPCVDEQYTYRKPVDNSSCNVAGAMLDLYAHSGDELLLAKAKALIDQLTVVQNAVTGEITSEWNFNPQRETDKRFWVNCCFADIEILLRMAGLTGETSDGAPR